MDGVDLPSVAGARPAFLPILHLVGGAPCDHLPRPGQPFPHGQPSVLPRRRPDELCCLTAVRGKEGARKGIMFFNAADSDADMPMLTDLLVSKQTQP